jgi:uncharacterized RDD family membrane protein YckC
VGVASRVDDRWRVVRGVADDPTAVRLRRLLAGVIDVALWYVIAAPWFVPWQVNPLTETRPVPADAGADPCVAPDIRSCDVVGDEMHLVTDATAWWIYGVAAVLVVVVRLVMESRTGSSPGKRLLRVKVVDALGNPPGFAGARRRLVMWVVDALPYTPPLVALVAMLVNRGHQRIGDMVANTFVVDRNHVGPVIVPGLATAATAWMRQPPTAWDSASAVRTAPTGHAPSWRPAPGSPTSPPGAGRPAGAARRTTVTTATAHGQETETRVGQLILHWSTIQRAAPRDGSGQRLEGRELIDWVVPRTARPVADVRSSINRRNAAAHHRVPPAPELDHAIAVAVAVAGEVDPIAASQLVVRCGCGQLNRTVRHLAHGQVRRCSACLAEDNPWARSDGNTRPETQFGPHLELLVGRLYLHWQRIEQLSPRRADGGGLEGSDLVDWVAAATGLGDAIGFSRRRRRRCGHEELPSVDEIERATQIAAEAVVLLEAAAS